MMPAADGIPLPKSLPIPPGLTMARVETASSVLLSSKMSANIQHRTETGGCSSTTSTGGKANATNVTTTIIINSVTGTIECTTGNGERSTGTVTINTNDLSLDGQAGVGAGSGRPVVEPVVYKILNAVASKPACRSGVGTGDTVTTTTSTRLNVTNGGCSTTIAGRVGERGLTVASCRTVAAAGSNGAHVVEGGDGGDRRCNTSITLPRSLGTVVGRVPSSKVNVLHPDSGTVAASNAVKIITVPGGHYRDVLAPAAVATHALTVVPPSVTNAMDSCTARYKHTTSTVPVISDQQQQYQIRREVPVQQHQYLHTSSLHPTPNSSFSQPNQTKGDGIASASPATAAADSAVSSAPEVSGTVANQPTY
uniref:Uncharacterized protein n=1 Tax=Anopheles maculatus TaxID=74869 RepID=A0A182T4J0_9DIPT